MGNISKYRRKGNHMKLALAIIAKDEFEQLIRIVTDYQNYFDEIVIAYDADDFDHVKEVIEQNCKIAKVYKYEWCDDFAHKRNWLADKVESEYYFRLDTDDVIDGVQNLDKVRARINELEPDVLYFQYVYSQDVDGNCVARHWRETIIRKDENHYWKKRIHENIFVEDQDLFKGAKEEAIRIIHCPAEGHHEESFDRNLKILLEEYNEDKENTDPRTIAYLGRMMMGLGRWAEAVGFLQLLVKKSGWDDDKYFAYAELGFCHCQLKEYEQAIAACFEAIELNPNYPDAYICLGEIYINTRQFKKANTWLTQANTKKIPDTMYVVDPTRYSIRLAMNLAMSYFGIGEFEKAKLFFDKASAIAPSNDFINENRKLIQDGYNQDQYIKKLLWILHYLKENDGDKIPKLIESAPKNVMNDERVQALRHNILPPKTWPENSIAIFCGESWEEWADPSVISGLGGSEEAVVYLSRELVKKGYDVTVFNGCGDLEGVYNGVKYEPYYNFNPNDKYDILIAWRGNVFKHKELKARKRYIWKHDVPQKDQYNKETLDRFDKIIVQSEYHKSLFEDYIPDDKFLVGRNGINVDDFKDLKQERNPVRMIYASSYDRGIQHLLQRWPEIREEVPNAELHLFYGWDVYDQMIKKGFRSKEFKDNMVQLMSQEGIVEHGRVGHKKLNKEYQKSGVWVYPCHFEEISCIAAMKAQANGAVPVVVDYAALKETVKEGVKVHGKADDTIVMDEYIKKLIDILKNENKQADYRAKSMARKEEFSWAGVADLWISDFNE